MPKCITRRLLSQRASAGSKPGSSGAREPAAAKKSWWRFWYRGTPNHPLQQTAGAGRLFVTDSSLVPPRLLSGVVRRKESSYDR
jgi:hypothetical protein